MSGHLCQPLVARALLPGLLLWMCACQGQVTPIGPPVGQSQQPINDGILEPGMPAVVYLEHQLGYACTGTIIGRRVVLTAKHCVQTEGGWVFPASGWRVWVGASRQSVVRSYEVSEVRRAPGTSIEDSDVAVMILSQEAVEIPYQVVFEIDEWDLVGTDALLVGYGVNSCVNGTSGTKYRTVDEVIGWYSDNDFVTEGQGANSGDSGGPVFDPVTMEVIGVMSRAGDCVEAPGYTVAVRVDAWRALISGALNDTGDCGRTSLEDICGDGVDNDCNGLVDDGCNPLMSACDSDLDCESRFCRDLGGVSPVCTLPCDLDQPGDCGQGALCVMSACDEGACVPGYPGSLTEGEVCGQDADCLSLLCRDLGGGTRRCLPPCQVGQAQCLGSEACAPLYPGDSCGGCAPDGEVPLPRHTGERCAQGADCASALCYEDNGLAYCTTPCDSGADCIYGFHCREGRCARGTPGQVGESCASDDDCYGSLACYGYAPGHPGYCTSTCPGTEQCPQGTVCEGALCALQRLPLGSACALAGDCSSTGCFAFGGEKACTWPCDRLTPCPPLSVCVVADNGMTLCQPHRIPVSEPELPKPLPKKRGCSVGGLGQQGGDPDGTDLSLLLTLGLLGLLGLARQAKMCCYWRMARRRSINSTMSPRCSTKMSYTMWSSTRS